MRIITLAIFIFSSAAWTSHAQDMPPASTDTTNHDEQIALGKQSILSWLALIDKGEYSKSWTNAGVLFKQALTDSQWVAQMTKVRTPLGKVLSREILHSQYTTFLPNAPKGEYVIFQFATSFAVVPGTVETVTSMKGPDGVWRAVGYFIRRK